MTTVSTKIIANRTARREADNNSRATKIMAAAFTKAYCSHDDDTVIIDAFGRRVRTSDASDADIRALLIGNRVVDTIDILEQVGEKAFTNLVNNGSLQRDPKFNRHAKCNMYWITTKARELYNLPARIMLSSGYEADYQEA